MLDILIVNHNNRKFTEAALHDLNQQTMLPNVRLINNGCTPDEIVEFGNINDKNEPLNSQWNRHIKSSRNHLCFLNNDVRLTNNFVSDTDTIFNKEPDVGIVIHITNNPNFISKTKLNYVVLDIPLLQGWDFTVREGICPLINSDDLKIFGGDDYLFAKIVSMGWKIALVYSSPVLHFREQTRKIIPNINDIQNNDVENLFRILETDNLKGVHNICNVKNDGILSYAYPTVEFQREFQRLNC
jgi:GT2 family glycosyltransferase